MSDKPADKAQSAFPRAVSHGVPPFSDIPRVQASRINPLISCISPEVTMECVADAIEGLGLLATVTGGQGVSLYCPHLLHGVMAAALRYESGAMLSVGMGLMEPPGASGQEGAAD